MDAEFDPTERRVIGVLVEKALSTPDYYPMSVNAIVAACNQKNNRDPVTSYAEFEVEGALRALHERKWAAYVEGGSRVRKWKHRLDERLSATPPELAVLAELLLRGPQQPGELRTRAERMANIPTQDALMEVLEKLAGHLPPLVVKLPRQSGERADRYAQTLAPDGVAEGRAAPDASAAPTASSTPTAPEPSLPSSAPQAPSLADRVARLEREVADLRSALEALQRR